MKSNGEGGRVGLRMLSKKDNCSSRYRNNYDQSDSYVDFWGNTFAWHNAKMGCHNYLVFSQNKPTKT